MNRCMYMRAGVYSRPMVQKTIGVRGNSCMCLSFNSANCLKLFTSLELLSPVFLYPHKVWLTWLEPYNRL